MSLTTWALCVCSLSVGLGRVYEVSVHLKRSARKAKSIIDVKRGIVHIAGLQP
ncbi:hypothetical protein PAXRUDRAFT_833332 [Paxillus rubicundulus Ve08.2h10]|uniref:Uncharacterized protein n=1 Tax=Paxillus rubicundulus Ve08.2h10 TaxID=930991 RepID=A0A0D0DHB0_9AGAM|nr:hypothetical protein PAXRUDRAFT_833332 [Paxillus rubicundulus Ve08.2h10]